MKRILTAMIVASILILPAAAMAQINFELGGGLAGPVGDADDYWKMGFGLEGTVLYELTPFSSIGINIGWSKLGIDEDAILHEIGVPSDVTADGMAYSVLNVCGEIRVHAGAVDMAYFFGSVGAGLYRIGLSDLEMTDGVDSETVGFEGGNKFGGYIQGGTAFGVTPNVKLGIKGRFSMFSGYTVETDEGFTAEEFGEFSSVWQVYAFLLIGMP